MRRGTIALLLLALWAVPASPAAARTDSISPSCYQTLVGSPQEAPPVGVAVPCSGIRPGVEVRTPMGGCTANFVFHGTSRDAGGGVVDEGLFIGTAGHCVVDGVEKTWARGEGPPVLDRSDARMGEVAYATFAVAGSESDFALIRIDAARSDEVNPQMCHFGGPTRIGSTARQGDVVHHFGQGLAWGATVPGRSGVVAPGTASETTLFFGSALWGDSGSPVITPDGAALGVQVGILPPIVFATNLQPQLQRASEQLGITFELQTAPLLP